MVGREVEIKKKDKKNFGKMESAFLKDSNYSAKGHGGVSSLK